ncbi:hypothetical protein Krac_6671 [Ktedonobacter racemifer DSM 44963]|uniref:Uncharacterized protein n=1 Tax=Ktedonobacter racemifer DSM 44963 TaxID=485913 RepID=D6TNR4_KTERA|nr:hypothetical protein Krac_6671 [Ktedonobacter racemifer DSM 44963]
MRTKIALAVYRKQLYHTNLIAEEVRQGKSIAKVKSKGMPNGMPLLFTFATSY